MTMKFTNNATSALLNGISDTATSLTVTSNTGALFPTLTGSDYFYCTIADAYGNVEIVKVTARSGDVFTIVRGQDSTNAATWTSGVKVELRVIAASLNSLARTSDANTFSANQTFTGTVTVSGVVTNTLGTVGGPWTTATRPSTPVDGQSGFNTTLNKLETWDATNSAWVTSGGATGAGGNDVFYENGQTVTSSYTITTSKNAMSTGPITISSGKSVTIPSGSRWVVL
jgi:hypothetical protein